MSLKAQAEFEQRVLITQCAICLAAAIFALAQGFWQMTASGLGSIAIIAPSAAFAWWSRRLLAAEQVAQGAHADAQGQEHAAQRVMGLAGVKLVVTMTLMVIAFALMRPQAEWVLVGIVAAALGAVAAAWIVSASQRKQRASRHSG